MGREIDEDSRARRSGVYLAGRKTPSQITPPPRAFVMPKVMPHPDTVEQVERILAHCEQQVEARIREVYFEGKAQGCGIRLQQYPGGGLLGVTKIEVAPDVPFGRAEIVTRA